MENLNLILARLLELQKKYSQTYRSTHSLSRYSYFELNDAFTSEDILNIGYRESLMEHVGHLPILATFLHPYLEHSKKVDLGKSLIMLSIHDIAETETGDINAFAKTDLQAQDEEEIAKKLLDKSYLIIFEEYEKLESLESKFAQSVDKLAPLLIEMTQMKIVPMKMKLYPYNMDKIKAKQRPKHEWDKFLTCLVELMLNNFETDLINLTKKLFLFEE